MSLKDELDALGAHVQLPVSRRKALMQAAALIEGLAVSVSGLTVPGATRSLTARRVVIDGDLAVPAGNITIGPVATGKGNVLINSDGIRLRTGTTNKINLTTGGDVLIGSDLSQPASQYISIFSVQQTYNSENFLAGDMLIGDNSTSKANIKWDKANGQLKFRGGTTTQAYVDTTGAITAGGGNAVLDASGITLKETTSLIQWTVGGVVVSQIAADRAGGSSGRLTILIVGGAAGNISQYELYTKPTGISTNYPAFRMYADGTALTSRLEMYGGDASFKGLIVGASLTDPTTMLDVRGSGTFTTGVNVGTATGAAAGEIALTGPAGPLIFPTVSDAGTATVPTIYQQYHLSSGTPAAGFGSTLSFLADSATVAQRTQVQQIASWATATDATRAARFRIICQDTGSREIMRGEASGSAPMIGFLGAAAVVKQATITQTYSTTSTTLAADTASNMVAGGTGTAAGGWDTAAHRDTSITAFTNLRTDVDNVKNVLNSVIDALQAYGLMG